MLLHYNNHILNAYFQIFIDSHVSYFINNNHVLNVYLQIMFICVLVKLVNKNEVKIGISVVCMG